MLIARDFVFLHVPKTGGTFVQQTILDFMSAETSSFTHAPYSELPATARKLPGFYIVRNPWDWYVSWYHYWRERGAERPPDRLWRRGWKAAAWELLDFGQASFAEFTTRACMGEFDTARMFPGFDCAGLDLYSCYLRSIVGEALGRDDYAALRYERLRGDVRMYLRDRADVGRDLLRALRTDPALRTSEHDPYPVYFDDGLRRLVGDKTRWICAGFGYSFGGKQARQSSRARRRPHQAREQR